MRAADGGLPPIVVFGLDGTLFETRPRTLQILFEFADSVENEAPAVAASLRRLEHGMIRRLLRDTLRTTRTTSAAACAGCAFATSMAARASSTAA